MCGSKSRKILTKWHLLDLNCVEIAVYRRHVRLLVRCQTGATTFSIAASFHHSAEHFFISWLLYSLSCRLQMAIQHFCFKIQILKLLFLNCFKKSKIASIGRRKICVFVSTSDVTRSTPATLTETTLAPLKLSERTAEKATLIATHLEASLSERRREVSLNERRRELTLIQSRRRHRHKLKWSKLTKRRKILL